MTENTILISICFLGILSLNPQLFLMLILQSLKGALVWIVGPHTVCILGGGNGNSLQYSFLEKFHGQRSLVGYSPWGHKELDTNERLSAAYTWYLF